MANPFQPITAFTSDTSAWTFDGFGVMPVPQPNDYEPNKELSGLLATGAAFTKVNRALGIKLSTAAPVKLLPLRDIKGVQVLQGYAATTQVTAIQCVAVPNSTRNVEALIRMEPFQLRDVMGHVTLEETLIFPAGAAVTQANVALALIRQINANPYRKCTAALKGGSTTIVLLTFTTPGYAYDVTVDGVTLQVVPGDSAAVQAKPAFGNGEWLKAMRLGTADSAHGAGTLYKVIVLNYQKDILTHGNGGVSGSLADVAGVQKINQIAYLVVPSALDAKIDDLAVILTASNVEDAEVKEYLAVVDNLTVA